MLLLSSQGEVSDLYPDPRMGMASPAPGGSEIASSPDGLFTLDEMSGTETLQVLVSAKPLTDLKSRLAAMKPDAPRTVLEDVGNLERPPDGKRGVTYTKTSSTCDDRTGRSRVSRAERSAVHSAVGCNNRCARPNGVSGGPSRVSARRAPRRRGGRWASPSAA